MKIDETNLYATGTTYSIAVNCSNGSASIQIASPVANGNLWTDAQCDALTKALADAAYNFTIANLSGGATFADMSVTKEVVGDVTTTMPYTHP